MRRDGSPFALFAGLRHTEAKLLDWQNIDFAAKQIKVIPETAKKHRLRYLEMSENLIDWLTPHRKSSGKIHFVRKQFDALRRKAAIIWPRDVLRHCYASYHLAMHENQDKTALQLGHRNTDVLFNHYRNLVTKAEAKEFWRILPN